MSTDWNGLTISVDSRIVPCLLTCIDMDPALLVLAVNLAEDMVFAVPHPAYSGTHSSAQHGEAVGELSSASPSGVKQCPDIGISRKALVCSTAVDGTAVEFYSCRTAGLLVWCRRCLTLSHSRTVAPCTGRVVDEAEEGSLKPSMRCQF